MDTLPDRIYGSDSSERARHLVHGRRHPAKMNLGLLADLVTRYTREGQTWLDPFGGVGSSAVMVLRGRSVVLVELEAHHAADAKLNAERLNERARGGATATVLQGDSRRLRELLGVTAAGAVGSPPYADTVSQHPAADDLGRRLERMAASGVDTSRKRNVGGPHGQHRLAQTYGAISSPPYGDLASRDRSTEPYARKDPERSAEYGQDSPSRNVDGYGKDGAQIGNLPMGTVTSPPYANAITETGGQSGARGGDAKRRVKQDYLTDEHPDNLSRQDRETYLDAVRAVYAAVYDVTPVGGVLVLVTGNYVRNRQVVDLGAHTVAVCASVGWTPLERWRAKKQNVSFWRRLHAKKGLPLIDYEDVLVFCKGPAPAWVFADLPPQRQNAGAVQPALLEAAG